MSAEEHAERENLKARKKPPRQKRNPIEVAINQWYERHETLPKDHNVSDLVTQAPKRWTAYGSLVLLPAGSFTSDAWRNALNSTIGSSREPVDEGKNTNEDDEKPRGPKLLWRMILDEISSSPKAKLTHLAVNEGIPLHSKTSDDGPSDQPLGHASENILRSPGGLRMLYGDFGPSTPAQPGKVTEDDFSHAFWVSTKQNGITQTWAPRWTMFSRGNIKEKARLLDFHDAKNSTSITKDQQDRDLPHRRIPLKQRQGTVAVDLYAGIGYFAFCYATLGFRVLCWELNPWSVEGLRRGAEANGWSVRVVHPTPETSDCSRGEEKMLREILAGGETIVVFLEDNTRAAGRIRRLDELSRESKTQHKENEDDRNGSSTELRMSRITHVNCGLLPTSQGSWGTAWEIASEAQRAWFHIHENVGVSDIETMKEEIRGWFAERARSLEASGDADTHTGVRAEHVELVKTFAPGVWHCVFDLYVKRSTNRNDSIT
ncbi:S-adenosyl-L-methionine-dependent methyltransferase [Xylaria arbuscula]|nr:S-adenosyl-L-methionine-dependent methyltransferase [Xylaria arbuscula]